ncbi:membrane-spanning 4-domains subfamily A member 4D-like [Etheostoma cragini]|uniref:membrane-spanning 4-domains subfamily A member 4D-like n=1 Tax=Etheostoma cragini TaxID=417921 RepID=UPI00155ED7FC|nr:membrane-spanning 4-domains subfamily A member 4D-like [Etheostoma cragini]XP_034736176.1 membrane-spanning 4-domains subfamily A member 4D-like [Etheostoma cragini]XP_034736184.1 membrane-spanning 4-domains subfamily A member 4D-like [Etheostoma cragini]
MSAELYCVSEPGGNNASVQSNTMGGGKPLHRFLKGQPKIIGIIVLVMGSSFFTVSIATMPTKSSICAVIPFFMQILFIISGIVYILTEHSPTKKTVTISLALSIATILGTCWTLLCMVPSVVSYGYYRSHDSASFQDMELSVDLIFIVNSVVGVIIFIVMSCLATSALRSTKSQFIVVMSTTPAETPVE